MSPTIVTSQAELDAALERGDERITIDSPAGVWLRLDTDGRSAVSIRGASRVGPVFGKSRVSGVSGSATITDVRDSASVTDVWDSASVTNVRGSATVTGVWDSATVTDVRDSASVTGVWDSATVTGVWDSASVTNVRDSASVTGVWDSATVTGVWDSASVTGVWDSASVTNVGGSATVTDVWDSASVTNVRGSATVTGVWGSATVHLHGRASAVNVGKYVAVHLHSATATTDGGVIIDISKVDPHDTGDWLDLTGAKLTDGTIRVYKAVRDNLRSAHGTMYPVGVEVTCDDWRADHDCGGGLHFSPTPAAAAAYDRQATRYLACDVHADEVSCIDSTKLKAPRCTVIGEVDRRGRPIGGAA